MTRNFIPFSWGLATGVAICFGLYVVALLVGLGGYSGFIPTYGAYFWPSSVFLDHDFQNRPLLFSFVLAISVVANAVLYGGIFALIRAFARLLRGRRSNV